MKVLSVTQELVSNPLADVEAEVAAQLDSLGLAVPQGPVAITVGSRGIDNLPRVIRAAGAWLKRRGAEPFVVPAMGSHNGATAAGQREMIETLGVTEASVEMPVRASMDCVKLGTVATGDVWMDRHCFESQGVLVINRVKLHTCFSGPLQSGITKMMVVGMGKIRAAETFHSCPTPQMHEMLAEMGRCIVERGKIWAGLALLEDGLDQIAEIHALAASSILEQEPLLVARHREYFPRIPVDHLRVLIVETIGKVFSGTGMDTNVIGRRGVLGFEDVPSPRIEIIAALRLAAASHGNALGVGLADFITRELRDAIDEEKTFINAFTTGEMERAKIPATLESDEILIEKLAERFGTSRWMFIPNTLHLNHFYASPDLREELESNLRCRIAEQAVELRFCKGRLQLEFSRRE